MTNGSTSGGAAGLAGINPGRLFFGSCFSLIATAVAFAVVGGSMGAMKTEFVLTNQQVGWIGGAALWGFTISIFVLGPLCDALGMRNLLWFAFFCHVAGVLIMITAPGFWLLFAGALVIALGNGTVEAACNPLVATIYPDQKTRKLNQFHVWFPGGIVIGGLAAFLLDKAGVIEWRAKVGLILIPAIVYGILFIGQKFPATERVQSGISFGGMIEATLLRPLFLLMLFCMMLTASLELGPNRWIPAVLEAGGIHGILVLVWISGLMAVLRFFAGPVVHRLSPTGILLGSAILSGLGLLWLSFRAPIGVTFAAATLFAVGVCYFWPTMLGVVAERVPKGGALALALMGGMGMAIVGLVTSPQMGRIADKYAHGQLPVDKTTACLQQVVATFPALKIAAKGKTGEDIQAAIDDAAKTLAAAAAANGQLPPIQTADALRSIIRSGGDAPAAKEAAALLNPADNYGGLISFRYVAPLAIILTLIFGALYASDLAKGGYKVEKIGG